MSQADSVLQSSIKQEPQQIYDLCIFAQSTVLWIPLINKAQKNQVRNKVGWKTTQKNNKRKCHELRICVGLSPIFNKAS